MKKIIKFITILFIYAVTANNTVHSAPPRDPNIPATPRSVINQIKKNDGQVEQLKKQMSQTKDAFDKAQTKEERQKLKKQLQEEFEKSVSFLDSTQNLFFGTGKIADHKKQLAEQRRPKLVQKLKDEIRHYQQLVKNPISKKNEELKQKSLEKQTILRQKIKIEDIALGNTWSPKQYALGAAAAAAATALGITYAAPLLAKGYGMYIAASNPITANMSWAGATAATAASLGLKTTSANIQGRVMRKIMQTLYPAEETAPLVLVLTQQFTPEEMITLGFVYNQQYNIWLTSTRKLIVNPDETPYKAANLPADEPDTD